MLAGFKGLLQIRLVKEHGPQGFGRVAEEDLDERHAADRPEPDLRISPRHVTGSPGGAGSNRGKTGAVFIAARKEIEEVADGMDAEGLEDFRAFWTDPFHVADLREIGKCALVRF